MPPADRFHQADPHPEALAQLFIEYGENEAALEVCRIWRAHDPSNPRIDQLEAEAEVRGPSLEGNPPLDVTDAERYLQKGYVREALFIYHRLSARSWRKTDLEIHNRIRLLEQFVAFDLPVDPPPKMVEAESQLRQRRLPMALLGYHELAEADPDDEQARERRDQLRALIMETPSSARMEEIAAIGDTINETFGGASPRDVERQQRLRPITEQDIPTFAEDPAQPVRPQLRAKTDLDRTGAGWTMDARESAPTQRELRIPPELLEPDGVIPDDELPDDQGPSMGPRRGPEPLTPGGTPAISKELLRRLAEQSPRRAMARTVPSTSPMVLTRDEDGRSVVEVPRNLPNVMERIPGLLSDHEAAAEVAESLGVLVRPIIIIDEERSR